MQQTLKKEINFVGIGLHSGRPARLWLHPATEGYGIKFRRIDVRDAENFVSAHWDNVFDTTLSTNIQNIEKVSVFTIEHILAALAGCGVTNALIDIDGPEVPIMDGSSKAFAAKILEAGVVAQSSGFVWEIRKTIRVEEGGAMAEFSPLNRCEIDFSIDFANTIIGQQSLSLDLRGNSFVNELANCRTFCKSADVTEMQANGLALGGSYDNALVVDEKSYLNIEGPRRIDECVRHKMLDALGDLALAGAPILGKYKGVRSGHRMTNLLLRKLFATDGAAAKIPVTEPIMALLPNANKRESDLQQVG